MSYKFDLYNIFRFHRNTNKLKQQEVEDKLKFLDKSTADIHSISKNLDNVAKDAYKDFDKEYSKRSPYAMILNAFKEVVNYVNLYLLRSVNNNNIMTADNVNSVKALAALTGFQAVNKLSASGMVNVIINKYDSDTASFIIQDGTKLKHKLTGLLYFVNIDTDYAQLNVRQSSFISLPIVQGKKLQQVFTGNAKPLQIFTLENTNIDLTLLEVFIGNKKCRQVNKLADMSFAEYAYVIRHNSHGGVDLIFGTTSHGYVPKMGEDVIVMYVVSDGILGNISANDEFLFVDGVSDNFGSYVDTRQTLKVVAQNDFINGYAGDDIEAIRLNAGLESSSNLLTTVDNYYAYMRRYPHINVIDVWSEPSISTVNLLCAPNLRQICNNRLCTYFDLNYSDFEFDSEEQSHLHSNIVSDRKYALMSSLKIYDYVLEPFGILIFVDIDDMAQQNILYNQTITVLHNALLNAYDEDAQIIRVSKVENELQDNIEAFKSVKVQFVGNDKYINDFGDIHTKNIIVNIKNDDKLILPYFATGAYDNLNFTTLPFKLLSKSGKEWVELRYLDAER